jgi:hypothetical protein
MTSIADGGASSQVVGGDVAEAGGRGAAGDDVVDAEVDL